MKQAVWIAFQLAMIIGFLNFWYAADPQNGFFAGHHIIISLAFAYWITCLIVKTPSWLLRGKRLLQRLFD